jgi:hypothetical protein
MLFESVSFDGVLKTLGSLAFFLLFDAFLHKLFPFIEVIPI